ncbi:MAG: hypothetical protein V4653_21135 [Pseudomonadota bacterium]
MSAGPWEKPGDDGITATMWRMVAIACAWFALLTVVMMLNAHHTTRDGAVQAEAPEPPAVVQAEPQLTRALRHGGSLPAPEL